MIKVARLVWRLVKWVKRIANFIDWLRELVEFVF